MKILNKLFYSGILALGLISCSQEAPFGNEYEEATGRVLKSSLSVNVKSETPLTRVSANGIPEVKDFSVDFYSVENELKAEKHYDKYGEMPEVVMLPAGTYYIKLSYGGTYGEYNETAAFNKPHYEGKSDEFTVEIDKIVDNIKPITCKLQNVRVSVYFDQSLYSVMNKDDSKVTVKLGDHGTSLDFYANTTQDGYFAYAEGESNLIATFSGTIDGDKVTENKSFPNVMAGNYYQLTFKLHGADVSGSGNIVPDDPDSSGQNFVIDATVIYIDNNEDDGLSDDASPDNQENLYVEDDMRPENGEDPNKGEEPGNSEDDPGNEDPDPGEETNGPVIKGIGVEIDVPNIDPESCGISVTSQSGITGFLVKIISEKLDKASLEQMQLTDEFDLLNPGQYAEPLQNLGFPVGNDVKNKTSVSFDISRFLPMLAILSVGEEATHTFQFTVTDSEDTSVNSLIIVISANYGN